MVHYFCAGSRIGQMPHTRIRTESSALKDHLYKKNIEANPYCICKLVETSEHFLRAILITGTRIPDPPFPHLVPPAIMVWIFVWKYIFEPFIHILQHFVLQLSRFLRRGQAKVLFKTGALLLNIESKRGFPLCILTIVSYISLVGKIFGTFLACSSLCTANPFRIERPIKWEF
jgi:hypothetical protein